MRKIGKPLTPEQEEYDFLLSVLDLAHPDKTTDNPYDKPGVYIDSKGIHVP